MEALSYSAESLQGIPEPVCHPSRLICPHPGRSSILFVEFRDTFVPSACFIFMEITVQERRESMNLAAKSLRSIKRSAARNPS